MKRLIIAFTAFIITACGGGWLISSNRVSGHYERDISDPSWHRYTDGNGVSIEVIPEKPQVQIIRLKKNHNAEQEEVSRKHINYGKWKLRGDTLSLIFTDIDGNERVSKKNPAIQRFILVPDSCLKPIGMNSLPYMKLANNNYE